MGLQLPLSQITKGLSKSEKRRYIAKKKSNHMQQFKNAIVAFFAKSTKVPFLFRILKKHLLVEYHCNNLQYFVHIGVLSQQLSEWIILKMYTVRAPSLTAVIIIFWLLFWPVIIRERL